MKEDKQLICDLLLKTLNATRAFKDLVSLHYFRTKDDCEYVTAVFENGAKKTTNVSGDSGKAIIQDVLHHIS